MDPTSFHGMTRPILPLIGLPFYSYYIPNQSALLIPKPHQLNQQRHQSEQWDP